MLFFLFPKKNHFFKEAERAKFLSFRKTIFRVAALMLLFFVKKSANDRSKHGTIWLSVTSPVRCLFSLWYGETVGHACHLSFPKMLPPLMPQSMGWSYSPRLRCHQVAAFTDNPLKDLHHPRAASPDAMAYDLHTHWPHPPPRYCAGWCGRGAQGLKAKARS